MLFRSVAAIDGSKQADIATRIEIARLHRELGATMVYVTHDQSEALAVSDRVIVMHLDVSLRKQAQEDIELLNNGLEERVLHGADVAGVRSTYEAAKNKYQAFSLLNRATEGGVAAQGSNRRPRIAGHGFFHAGADERRFGANQRHRLALHVRTHQRTVGVIVL